MYTCNGSPKGCERARFGHCNHCDQKQAEQPPRLRIADTPGDTLVAIAAIEVLEHLYRSIEKFVADCELTNCHQNHQALCDLNKSLKDARHSIREINRALTPAPSG